MSPVDDGLAPREDTPGASTVWGWCYCGAHYRIHWEWLPLTEVTGSSSRLAGSGREPS